MYDPHCVDFWEPGFGFVIFKGFGFMVYQSFDFATNLFDCKNTCNNNYSECSTNSFGFGFVTKALASASKAIRVKASASNFLKASASAS